MRPGGKLGKVVEWIDGATIHRSGDGEEDGSSSGFAWTLYDLDLRILTKLVPIFSNDFHRISRKDVRNLKQSLGDLFLWGDGFRDGRLEEVVEESDDLEETLVSSLVRIGRLLISVIDDQREIITLHREEFKNLVEELRIILEKARTLRKNSLDNEGISGGETTDDEAREERGGVRGFIYSLKIYTTCLMDLLPSMEDTLSLARQVKDEDQPSVPLEFHVSGPARTYILNICDRFPKADSKLVERLGEANWQRHTALRRLLLQADSSDFPVEEPAKSVFVPVSLFQDSGLGSSLPSQTSYATTSASHTSFVSSQADEEGGGLRVPPTPKAVIKGTPFNCEICGQTLSQIKNRVDWKRHVFADLKPYLCTFSDCKDALKTFPTRKMWETHEFEQHRFDTVLCCSLCPRRLFNSFSTEEEGNGHLNTAHGRGLEKKAPGFPLGLYKQRKPHEAASLSCPLCLCVPGTSRRNFVTHVSKHIESIALAALPRDNGSDSESGSDARSVTTASSDHASDDGHSPVGSPAPGTMGRSSTQQDTTLQPSTTPVPQPQIGRVEAPPPPAPGQPAHVPPPPPAWLTQGLADLLKEYPNDRFEGVMCYSAISTATELRCAAPPSGEPTPEGIKYMYLPRIRCHDCPGKLYSPGPETTVGNFEVHLKNRQHRERVDGRVAGGSSAASGSGGAYLDQLAKFHKQHGTNLKQFPTVDKRPLDLYKLRQTVETMGGFDEVCKMKKWPQVGRILGYEGKIMSSLSTSLKNSYQRWLVPYEEHRRLAKEGLPLERHAKERLTTPSEVSRSPDPPNAPKPRIPLSALNSDSESEEDRSHGIDRREFLREPKVIPQLGRRHSIRSTAKSPSPDSDAEGLKFRFKQRNPEEELGKVTKMGNVPDRVGVQDGPPYNFMFSSPEVTNEYNLFNDFLSTSLLDDGALPPDDTANFLTDQPGGAGNSNSGPSGTQAQTALILPENPLGNSISRPKSVILTDKSREYYLQAADPTSTRVGPLHQGRAMHESPYGGENKPPQKRVYQACDSCRQGKVKCDMGSVDKFHGPPCVRCRRETKECIVSERREKRGVAPRLE